MKTLAFRLSLLAIGCFFIFGTTCYAMPVQYQDAKVTRDGDARGFASGGGEFLLKIYDDGANVIQRGIGTDTTPKGDYISFCLEFTEHIQINRRYDIAGVDDFAAKGGAGGDGSKDFVSDQTKWLFWNYLYNGSNSNLARTTTSMANDVQRVIWFYENEDGSTYDESFADPVNLTAATTFFGSSTSALTLFSYVESQTDYSGIGNVKVLNLVSYTQDDQLIFHQSQLVAEPVPEPATMMLFGTGLIGLAGIARRRSKKK